MFKNVFARSCDAPFRAIRSNGCPWRARLIDKRSHRIAEYETARRYRGQPLRVGSWPGPSYNHNAFISIFCSALRSAGVEVVDVVDPRRVDPAAIDILHIHWPEQIFWRGLSAGKTLGLLVAVLHAIGRLRSNGVTIVWMVHNLRPHGARSLYDLMLWRACAGWLGRMIDGFVTLSPATLEVVTRTMKFASDLPAVSVRHPHYGVPTLVQDRKVARVEAQTGNPDRLIVAIGHVKRYKGLEALARTVADGDNGTKLVIAGNCQDEELSKSLCSIASQAGGKIDLRLERQSDAAFAGLVRAADYVVLPFSDYLHSGSIVHALSLGAHVLTPDTPYARDLASVVGTNWVQTYAGEISWSIIATLPDPGAGAPDLNMLSPSRMGRSVVSFYERLRAKS